jgi:hypothetical protein
MLVHCTIKVTGRRNSQIAPERRTQTDPFNDGPLLHRWRRRCCLRCQPLLRPITMKDLGIDGISIFYVNDIMLTALSDVLLS